MSKSMFISSSRAVATSLFCVLASALAWAQQPAQLSIIAPPPPADNPVLWRVGVKEEYRLTDVQAYGKRRTDLVSLLKSTEGLAMVVQEMAMTRALVLEGEKTNEFRDATEPGTNKDLDDIYALRVYKNVAGTCPEPTTEQESRAYYDQNPQAFVLPVQVKLSRVMLPANALADKMPAEMWMGLQASAVAMGSARFDALVERGRAISPELKQGDLGWVRLEGDQPLIKALTTAKEGELLGPIRDGDFLYLLQVQQRREKIKLPFDTVRHQVPMRAVEYCRETERNRVRTTLFSQYGIEVDTKAIRNLGAQ